MQTGQSERELMPVSGRWQCGVQTIAVQDLRQEPYLIGVATLGKAV